MSNVTNYAFSLIKRGYACHPVNVSINDDRKVFSFRDGGWKDGQYPVVLDSVESYWNGYEGILINTGRSGVVVVDIDCKKGQDGFKALAEKGLELPDTPVKAETPSGGEHWYYRTGEVAVSNSQGKLAEGVDIRGVGGFVVAPPTPVGSGSYSFPDPSGMVEVSKLPEFPQELSTILYGEPWDKVAEFDAPPVELSQAQQQYYRRILDVKIEDIANGRDGGRTALLNQKLPRVVGIAKMLGEDSETLAEFIRDAYKRSGGQDSDQCDAMLRYYADHAKPELPNNDPDPEQDRKDTIREQRIEDETEKERVKREVKDRLAAESAPRIDPNNRFDPNNPIPERPWYIQRVLPKDDVVMMVGESQSGKTAMTIDLVAGMMTGTRSLGSPVQEGKVLYLAGEGFQHDIPGRLLSWSAYNKTPLKWDNLHLFPMELSLGSKESVEATRSYVAEQGIDLVVLDTFSYSFGDELTMIGLDDGQKAVAGLRRIITGKSGCTLLALHHPKDQEDAPAGSKAWVRNIDFRVHVYGSAHYHGKSLVVRKDKSNGPGYKIEGQTVGCQGNPVFTTGAGGWGVF